MNHSQPVLSKGSLYMQTTQHLASSSRPNMIVRPLKFPTRETAPPSAEFQLPDIEPYLPPGTDRDAVQSLLSVYRNHCLLVIDSFRYCKADKLCDSYKSMVGLLTVPGQKLLAHPSIAPWIKKCDWLKYQKMFPMLDMIILTQVPGKAMLQLENISLGLCSWISTFFHAQPQHVQDAMFGPAHVFKSLLDRFLRVNRSAVDVADILANPDNRDQLWRDWVNHVNPYHVLQNSLQEHGHKRVLHMLTQEVRFLLTPMEDPQLALGDSLFADNGVRSDFQSMMLEQGNTSSSQILHRLAKFIESIAPRFPGLNARSILNYIDIIGNNISRDLSFNGAPCLANWWRVRLFVDEMSYWLAEKGGFLENGVESMTPHLRSPFASFNFDTTNDFGPKSSTSSAFEPQPDQSRFPDTSVQKQPEQDPSRSRGNSTVVEDDGLGGVPDDSGIGLGLDDDFEMDTKYNSFVGGVHGSDPADVVVC